MDIPTPDDIAAAARRIAPSVHRTPVMSSDALLPGRSLELKLENTQKTGSFKVRGAFETLLSGTVPEAGVVAASGGNHGAAVAHAARALGHRAKIFVPEIAGPSKIALIEETGAELEVVGGAYSNALEAAQAWEAETGAGQIHAYDAFGTLAGQGTVMAEWEDQGLEADTVLIAVGGGGLIGGALAWLDGRRKVVAVESEGTATLHTALRDGPGAEIEVSGIAANALGARKIGARGYELARRYGVESVLVSDEAIADAQRRLWRGVRQWVEPAGAAALAALSSGAYRAEPDERIAVLVCGANPAPAPF
ncbi:serine/threonine dehydratase [Histidinibacterium aquaticum]|uniref:Pyridoxal-phosphate dependent enzyme n=1 Tax=Histidinibacterium aquaticum TaxID=2613962 RepID=A0A5J5GDI2_9RHOB|nr:serine/threonine dehydratase [Histidinibacterium aquaticum]KAA9006131.1 pyridoxal-phosphate dependent enzyme [Histidinibacterium aquaticum]